MQNVVYAAVNNIIMILLRAFSPICADRADETFRNLKVPESLKDYKGMILYNLSGGIIYL